MLAMMIALASAFGQDSVTVQRQQLLEKLEASEARSIAARCQAIDQFIATFGNSAKYINELEEAHAQVRNAYDQLGKHGRRLVKLWRAQDSTSSRARVMQLQNQPKGDERQRIDNYYQALRDLRDAEARRVQYHRLLRVIRDEEISLIMLHGEQIPQLFEPRNPQPCSPHELSSAQN